MHKLDIAARTEDDKLPLRRQAPAQSRLPHIIAIPHRRIPRQPHLARKEAAGKSHMEAIRCLKPSASRSTLCAGRREAEGEDAQAEGSAKAAAKRLAVLATAIASSQRAARRACSAGVDPRADR